MFKFLLFLIIVSSVYCALDPKHYHDELVKKIEHLHKECQFISGATEADIKSVRAGNFNAGEKTKRYNVCLWIHGGVVNFKLEVDEELLKRMEPQILSGVASKWTKCAKLFQTGDIENQDDQMYLVAWNATKCMHDIDPKNFIYP